jgi:hypothetical protein
MNKIVYDFHFPFFSFKSFLIFNKSLSTYFQQILDTTLNLKLLMFRIYIFNLPLLVFLRYIYVEVSFCAFVNRLLKDVKI